MNDLFSSHVALPVEPAEPTVKSKSLILVDGSSFLFRAFHALPPLTAPDGTPTGAIHGVINMLQKLRREENPDRMAVVFDAPGPTFRDELYPEYKAQRPPLPDDLRVQIEPVHELVRALGFPLLCVSGVEADDVIGTLMHQARQNGESVLVATADKDFAQLVTEGIRLVNTMTNTVLDEAAIEAKYGITAAQFIDYLTLVGDTVDNVPGVPGCGPKTAAKWLNEWQSLDNLMAHADQIKGKVGESLRAAKEFLPIGRELVTIRTDCDLPIALADLAVEEPDVDAVRALAEKFGLNTLRRQFSEASSVPAPVSTPSQETRRTSSDDGQLPLSDPPMYETILTDADWQRWLEQIKNADKKTDKKMDWVAFDTETDSLDLFAGRIVGVSFSIEDNRAAYVPLAHNYPGAPAQLDRDTVLADLKPWLEDASRTKVMQNAKFDSHMLANHGITLRGVLFDTMLESYVLDSTATRHDMDSLAAKYLGRSTITFEDIAGKGAKALSFPEIHLEQAGPYAAEDADVTGQLQQCLWPKLSVEPDLRSVYETIEQPLIEVLVAMERAGVRVDRGELAIQGKAIGERIAAVEQAAFKEAGREFNLGSTKQLKELLFDELKLPVGKKTPKGEPSTDEEALGELVGSHPLPALILDYRGLSKLKSTYIDRLPEDIHTHTGRVHSAFHQAVTATGRLSSSNPNLQNIPIRSEEGRRIRQAFVADPGCKLISADYSQIELRIMAHLSEDERLCAAFAAGEDIHRATAAEVFGVKEVEVSDNQRRAAKAINFGLIYGMSAFGLAKQLDVPRGEAQAYIDLYFARYPGVAKYMERMRQQARQMGYVETVFGRRLYLPEIHSRNGQRRQYAERTAINAPMQGTAADIIKIAMIALHKLLVVPGRARMILQVHDELIFEVPESDVAEIEPIIRAQMTGAAKLNVPLEVGIGIGRSWAEAH
ncbi:DNA polymerase I [Halothiobacillus neapolitanus]|uniref:DNA polymerase I n=1 Tax=Halothiobacillus neapolitanus (strain ATCC 23641 / DSM 15147 / CIP 104769 / NCIMB 8539 / c2) TaxID=555778 RepID=D0L1E0_HALNC|nr:DNA polymerase I [Halothiobacillus neapolitanus]ACX96513.1 DNA polymerase I [Halothiobacillus neapolitanus c2]TDN65379.1 DNA polymerase I [Halothiobacillus neapolitanus]